MKSSITLRSIISDHKNKDKKTEFEKEILNVANSLKDTESTFSVGRGKNRKTFTKVTHFASIAGHLCPATGGGYRLAKDDKYESYSLQVSPGTDVRMFNVIYDNQDVVMVINASKKMVPFSKRALGIIQQLSTTKKRNRKIIGQAMKTLNQMVGGEKLTGEFSVRGDGTFSIAPEPYKNVTLTRLLAERNLKISGKSRKIFMAFTGTTQRGINYSLVSNNIFF